MTFGTGSRKQHVFLWVATCSLAFLLCLNQFSATLSGGVFVPGDHDSFYHARRILDAIVDFPHLLQFDPFIHAPEGSWVTWPWAFDLMMALIARAGMAVSGVTDPMRILVFVAPCWVFINGALLLVLALRLRLSWPFQILVMLAFSVSSLTRGLHRVGMLDHHFVEYTCVLALLITGLGWCRNLKDSRQAALVGGVLGMAPAFHNGLFILQLPLLLSLCWMWLLGRELPPGAAARFALALLSTTLLFLLPSEAFQQGMFSYDLLSWFHCYIASCSALMVLLISRLRMSRGTLAVGLLVAVVLAIPCLTQILAGGDFLMGNIVKYDQIAEVQSVFRRMAGGEFAGLTRDYSALLWLLPLSVFGVARRIGRDIETGEIFFTTMTLFGVVLLLLQFRLHYFGSFALYLPLCLLVQDVIERSPTKGRWLVPLFAGAVGLACWPSLAAVTTVYPLGADFQYALTRSIYQPLHELCSRAPGIVLAEHGDGHYIRYHTDCAVMANNFILTPQHQRKVLETQALLDSSLATVRSRAPDVRYLLLRRGDNVMLPVAQSCFPHCVENQGLRQELLIDGPPFPPGVRLIAQIWWQNGQRQEPLARLFEVQRE
jgi:hypothetical protein